MKPGVVKLDLHAVRSRQPAALEAFFETYFDAVYNLAFRFFGRHSDAEDLTQDVFLRVQQAIESLDPKRDPWPWLATITRNLFTDRTRSAPHRLRTRTANLEDVAEPSIASEQQPEESVLMKEEADTVQQALMGLPEDQREVVLLRDYLGMTHEAVSDMTGLTSAAVRKRYSRALSSLGTALRGLLQ